ncbi:hypothetical protein PM10SUCC1_30610 [Propionigenium maris DSM 9537]|uniref:Type II secretory pathway, pseudopilin PulG n=1 Tax=Propionigenium maris DSM 9537 TaxID=1123000 RepID=A0A9W6GNC7_9FUSO|nr:hypothetical protein [Propionigenium maris]GLI57547.1 hypothetical protein PM10SUCC1_30610 [Propionigenium maris DSM 9537]
MEKREGYAFIGVLIMTTLMTTLLASQARIWLVADKRVKEKELGFNLIQIKRALDEYSEEEGEYPKGLDELIEEGFLRRGYRDPNNNRNHDWKRDWEYDRDSGEVWSRVKGKSLGGVSYTRWKVEKSNEKYIIVEAEEDL